MTTTEKLKRMIERAVENGWKFPKEYVDGYFYTEQNNLYKGGWFHRTASDIILSEGFGKAVFGSHEVCNMCGSKTFDYLHEDNGEINGHDLSSCSECGYTDPIPAYIYHQRSLIPFKDDEDLINRAYKSIFGGEK